MFEAPLPVSPFTAVDVVEKNDAVVVVHEGARLARPSEKGAIACHMASSGTNI